MANAVTAIPVEHHAAIHEIDSAETTSDGPRPYTLLELVNAISEVSDDEREVVATVVYMLKSGRIRLRGNFRDLPISSFLESHKPDPPGCA